ncbi:hypothetical protein FSP39_000676 [Pinctada imbricata]|uniref:Serine/threonine-protein phosphatase 1 regulatory subunit 10 n=1 Tax=Pinctada imbricata TaxID=66713 RepID=A0AA88XKI2_PINIB|nr:hypothetical protein FSP39_000676 [Pinctada imbricata]
MIVIYSDQEKNYVQRTLELNIYDAHHMFMIPPIDPHQLLKALSSLLTQTGAIKGTDESIRIVNLMKDANKLVSRCVYINILRATVSEEALEKFIEVGGWDILNAWLQDCKEQENTAVLVEMLKVYQQMPVTVELLKKNSSAKTIKSFSKSEDERVKTLSSDIVDKWMKKVRGASENNNQESSSKPKKKKSDKKDKADEKKEEKEKKEKDNHKHKHHKHKSEKSESKQKSKDDDLNDDVLSAGSTGTVIQGNGLKLHIKLGRPNPDADSDNKNEKNWSRKEKSSDSSSVKRASTVKRPNVKFRSTGLEEDITLQPKKNKPADDSVKNVSKRTGSDTKSKDEPADKKARLNVSVPEGPQGPSPNPSPTSESDMHTKIKITPPKPKSVIMDSSLFMEELAKNSDRPPVLMKRRKKTTTPLNTNVSHSTGPNGGPPTPTTPSQKSPLPPAQSPISPTTAIKNSLPSVPSFYKDTLETSEEKRSPSPPTLERSASPTEGKETKGEKERKDSTEEAMDTSEKKENEEIKSEENEASNDSTSNKTSDDGSGVLTLTKSGKKKKNLKVSWAAEANLRQYHYFELDETERENVNRPKNFMDMKKQEAQMDRKAMETARRLTNDSMVESIPWRRPPLIDGLVISVDPGSQSTEKQTQRERETSVLQAIFFTKEMLPDTPSEPDLESVEPSDPKFIPLEDENGGCEEISHTYDNVPPPSMGPPPMGMPNQVNSLLGQLNITPEVANILQSFQQGGGLPPNMDPTTAQNMLASIMGTSGDPVKSEEAFEKLKGILEPLQNMNNPGMPPMPGPMGPFGPPGPNGPPMEAFNMGPGGPPRFHMPGQGLLGTAPPGFNPMMGPPNGPPRFGPGGPGGPPGGPRGPGMGDQEEWGENMMGGPPMRGRGRGGMPMRGGRMPPPGHQGGPRGPPPNMMRGGRGGGNRGRGGGGGGGAGGGGERAVCRHFAAGGCRRGNTCSFLHPGVNGPPV